MMKMLGYWKDGKYISTDMALYCLLRERGYEIDEADIWFEKLEGSLYYGVKVPEYKIEAFKKELYDFKKKEAYVNLSKLCGFQTEFRKILEKLKKY